MSKLYRNKKLIAESVTYLHPDKICDQLSDALLDEYMRQDTYSRVAIETVGGHGYVGLFGEVTSRGNVDCKEIVRKSYQNLTGQDIKVVSHISKQSPEIAQGVDGGGAGDQGIMVGYACSENEYHIPQEMYLARKLLEGYTTDGKSQVTIENGKITSVVLSVQGQTKQQLLRRLKKLKLDVSNDSTYTNNTGAFEIGGFDADSGCTGRKIVVDAYGPRVPVGGGAFSGKDATKVDRSAAYMARWIALQLLKKYGAHEVVVRLGYVIGSDRPLIKSAIVDGRETRFSYDCRPLAIIEQFDMRKPIYARLARYGHFGNGGKMRWDLID